MRRKWSASPSGSAGGHGSIAHPRSMRCRSADRPGRRTIGHESAIPSHRQSRPESPQWTKTDNHLGDDETMHTQTQRSSSAARARRGRRVVERLRARGLPVRVGSRSGEPPFDWEDRSTWAPALDGVASAYVSYYPDIATPGAVEKVRSFAEIALEHGVRRLVLLSGRGEEEAQRAEQAVQETGADWTILRSAWFMQNFSEDFLMEP